MQTLVWIGLPVVMAAIGWYLCPRRPDNVQRKYDPLIMAMNLVDVLAFFGSPFGMSYVSVMRGVFGLGELGDKPVESVKQYKTVADGVGVTVFSPAAETEGLRPGIIHFHGGGWVFASVEAYSPLIRGYVEETQSVIMSVSYRLSPENPFPIPFQDCLTAAKHFLRNAEKYGVDKEKIAVKGDSAGGNLALAVALDLAVHPEPDLPSLKLMSIDYAALQAFDFNLPSYKQYDNVNTFLTKSRMLNFWLLYAFGNTDYFNDFSANNHTAIGESREEYFSRVGKNLLPEKFLQPQYLDKSEGQGNVKLSQEVKDIILNPQFSPLLAPDEHLKLLPDAYVMVTDVDVLRDEGLILCERLKRAGVKVKLSFWANEEHSFIFNNNKNAVTERNRFVSVFNETMRE